MRAGSATRGGLVCHRREMLRMANGCVRLLIDEKPIASTDFLVVQSTSHIGQPTTRLFYGHHAINEGVREWRREGRCRPAAHPSIDTSTLQATPLVTLASDEMGRLTVWLELGGAPRVSLFMATAPFTRGGVGSA